MTPNLYHLAKQGDEEAIRIYQIMLSPDYTKMNPTPEAKAAKLEVQAYFERTFGAGPAQGSRQNNTTETGGWRIPSENF